MDPDNKSLWSALRGCQEAEDNDKKVKFAAAAKERAAEEAQMKLRGTNAMLIISNTVIYYNHPHY